MKEGDKVIIKENGLVGIVLYVAKDGKHIDVKVNDHTLAYWDYELEPVK